MENNNEHNIKKGHFDAFVHAVGSEIEQAQVRLITAANAQMLFHYWKMGNYILYHQHLHGWGGKIIKKLAQAIRFNYPEKKGYSERNLTYMCQFAKLSRSWRRQSDSITRKRKDIRSVILLICASLPVYIR